MLTIDDIREFIDKQNYNLEKRLKITTARWIDQKCTADVVTVIADCILEFLKSNPDKEFFTTKDIWFSDFANYTIEAVYKKPRPDSFEAKNEYDKFFQQPMEFLAYAGVLGKLKKGRSNIYKISNLAILEYIAIREKNALFFIQVYLEKFILDNDLSYVFEQFFSKPNDENYAKLKEVFTNFIYLNMKIKNKKECWRIFTKVINPLAYLKNTLGTEGGRVSKHIITYDMLMYNRSNFRDRNSGKPKNITRKEYLVQIENKKDKNYYKYQSAKAKRFLHLFNEQYRENKSEYNDEYGNGNASEIHHIFPESKYPEISFFLENLIALTPTQHMNCAHKNHKTNEICETYQHLLLLSKTDTIQKNLTNTRSEKIYEFSKLLYVLNVGFDDENLLGIGDMDFEEVVKAINLHYVD